MHGGFTLKCTGVALVTQVSWGISSGTIYNKGLDLFIADISSLKGDVKLGGKQNTADAGI